MNPDSRCCCTNKKRFDDDVEEMSLETFVSIMEQFYNLGWMRGTGGAMAVLNGDQYWISPSSLQKERFNPSDIFIFKNGTSEVIQRPINDRIKESSCFVLFETIMKETGSKCVIHTHSKTANLLTQLISGAKFEMSHQEYIKGIYNPISKKNLRYHDTMIVPIIGNKPKEEDLLPDLVKVLLDYKESCAMLVRNHGLFVWGPTWHHTKIMTECYDYLFDLAVEMIKFNIPLTSVDHDLEITDF